jgi:hypothetical protein
MTATGPAWAHSNMQKATTASRHFPFSMHLFSFHHPASLNARYIHPAFDGPLSVPLGTIVIKG